MKRFTVKDFIAYNNPCFSCGNAINFRIGVWDVVGASDPQNTVSNIRPLVTPDCTEIDLRITYNDALKLFVHHKTNKISTNNMNALIRYIDEHRLYLSSTCDRCYTHISSEYLDFDFDKNVIKAIGIRFERLLVDDNENHYRINSFYDTGKSDVVIDKTNTTGTLTPIILDLPLMPRHLFRNKEHFIKKMKLYMIFS